MGVDEIGDRFSSIERKLKEIGDAVTSALTSGSQRDNSHAEDLLARLPAEDRELLEKHRFRSRYGGVLDEWFEEKMKTIEAEAVELEDKLGATTDTDTDDTDADDDVKPKAKTKPAARKPPGRHPAPSPTQEGDDMPDGGTDPAKPKRWWLSD
ncbi:MAG TPA: hypothetical protein VFG23_19245 [Polyangia bacterium]|nr:hypothetical protein [Polyangia bacterium]